VAVGDRGGERQTEAHGGSGALAGVGLARVRLAVTLKVLG